MTTAAWARFDRWAGALLMLFTIIAVVAAILVASATQEPLFVVVILAAGLATAAIYVLAVYGLSAGRAWARPVAVTLLWVAIVLGLVGDRRCAVEE
jgi:hypothetical protein